MFANESLYYLVISPIESTQPQKAKSSSKSISLLSEP